MIEFHATTICAVRRPNGDIAIGGDGQVTMGETTIMKNGAKKVKKIYKDKVLTGFAGSRPEAVQSYSEAARLHFDMHEQFHFAHFEVPS